MNEIQLCDCILHIARVSFQLSVCTHIDWYSLSLCFGVRLVCSGLPVSTLQTVCVCVIGVCAFFSHYRAYLCRFRSCTMSESISMYLGVCVCSHSMVVVLLLLLLDCSITVQTRLKCQIHTNSIEFPRAEQRMNERKGEGERARANES